MTEEEHNQISDLNPDEMTDDQIPEPAALSDEILLQDEKQRSIKKVELDIEELSDELDTEEESRPEGEAPAEIEEEAPPTSRVKIPRFKLFLVGVGTALAVILILVGLILALNHTRQKGVTKTQPLVQPKQNLLAKLKPFLVDYNSSGREVILKLTITLSFSGLEAKNEFEKQRVIMRDLIYRFLQGRGLIDLNKRAALLSLQQEIAKLINSALTRGRVKKVLFQEFLIV